MVLLEFSMERNPGFFGNAVARRLETEARRDFSQVRATQAYPQWSVEETEREKPRPARESGDVVGIHEASGL